MQHHDMQPWRTVLAILLPIEATDAEMACFAAAMAGMSKGWGSGCAIMDQMFVELQADGGWNEE